MLITGESGTGKELAARAIHNLGPWSDQPFVAVNCGTLSRELIESELFGHVRGAYTGALEKRRGLMASAGRGTLFLDEVGELPLDLQVKLLRAIQEREFRPVGCDQVVALEARVLAATNINLEGALAAGRFRADLYYRLNVHELVLPALRARREDIPALVQFFLLRHAEPDEEAAQFSRDAMDCMLAYAWPGNVRELENCVQRALAAAPAPLIQPPDLPPHLARLASVEPAPPAPTYLEQAERRAILEVLQLAGGNRVEAAQRLGVSKATLYRKLREYGIVQE